jgi:hypothetical protein
MTDEERGPENPEGSGPEEAHTESPRPQQRQITLPALPKPTLTRVAWFGGLTVAGVVGALEWPVAVAVGVGSVVAERLAREHGHGPKVT